MKNTLVSAIAVGCITTGAHAQQVPDGILDGIRDETSASIITAISDELGVKNLNFSPQTGNIKDVSTHGKLSFSHSFDVNGRPFELRFSTESHGGLFTTHFDINRDDIPPQVMISEDTIIPDRIGGGAMGYLAYEVSRGELAMQIHEGKNCEYWGSLGVAKYEFSAQAELQGNIDIASEIINVQGYVSAQSREALYNPYIGAEISCNWEQGRNGSWYFNGRGRLEFGNSEVQLDAGYQHQFNDTQWSANVGVQTTFRDFYNEFAPIRGFHDGWRKPVGVIRFEKSKEVFLFGKTGEQRFTITGATDGSVNMGIEFGF